MPSTVLVQSATGEVWCVAAPEHAPPPTLGVDGICCVFRQMDSISECARMASVSSEFAAAFRGWLAETHVVDMRNVCCDDGELERILQGTPSARSILLGSAPDVTSEGVASAIASAKALHGWRHLDHLALQSISASELWELLSSLEHLTALDIDDNALLDELDVCMLASGCAPAAGRLKRLSMARCPNLSGLGSVPLLCQLLGGELRSFDASGYDELGSAAIETIGLSCPELRQVRLAESESLIDADIALLASRCAQLRVVDLSWCSKLTIESVAALVNGCIELERLELRCCAEVAAPNVCTLVGRGCPGLQLLNLNRCAHELDASAEADAEAATLYHQLTELTLLPSSTPSPASAAEQEAAREVEGCARLAPTLACRLVQPLAACRSLVWLDVGWLSDLIDDDAAALLLSSLPLLQVLSLEQCPHSHRSFCLALSSSPSPHPHVHLHLHPHPHPHPHPPPVPHFTLARQVLSLEGCKLLTNAALSPLLHMPPTASTSPCPLMTKDPISHARPHPESIVGSTMMAQGDVVARSSISPQASPRCQPSTPLSLSARSRSLPAAHGLCHSLLRLNCSWVDCITNECLHDALRAASARERYRRASGARGRARSQLLVLDYYGTCWGCGGRDGSTPERTKLVVDDPSLPAPLSGWVAAWWEGEDTCNSNC